MLKEVIGTGRTTDAAIADGASQLGVDVARVQYEIIDAPKKGFLGFGETPAKVKVFIEIGAENTALEYIRSILNVMEINANTEIARELSSECGKIIKINGEESGILIGHHGETLDALQYLANLALNAKRNADEGEVSEDSPKITVDIEGYRARREETLRNLAKRTAEKVKKYRKNIALDPMTPYERRIIHASLQSDNRVTTNSIGSNDNRRVVIHFVGERKKEMQKVAKTEAQSS